MDMHVEIIQGVHRFRSAWLRAIKFPLRLSDCCLCMLLLHLLRVANREVVFLLQIFVKEAGSDFVQKLASPWLKNWMDIRYEVFN